MNFLKKTMKHITLYKKSIFISILIHVLLIFFLNLSFDKNKIFNWNIKLAQGFQSSAFQMENIKVIPVQKKNNRDDDSFLEEGINNANNKYSLSSRESSGVQSKLNNGISNPEPKYPLIAKRWGWEGMVSVKIEILKNGNTGKIKILKSSGYPILDNSAVDTIKTWRFSPQKKDIYKKLNIEFKLDK